MAHTRWVHGTEQGRRPFRADGHLPYEKFAKKNKKKSKEKKKKEEEQKKDTLVALKSSSTLPKPTDPMGWFQRSY